MCLKTVQRIAGKYNEIIRLCYNVESKKFTKGQNRDYLPPLEDLCVCVMSLYALQFGNAFKDFFPPPASLGRIWLHDEHVRHWWGLHRN